MHTFRCALIVLAGLMVVFVAVTFFATPSLWQSLEFLGPFGTPDHVRFLAFLSILGGIATTMGGLAWLQRG